jgi:cell division transport system permease protein
MSIPKDFRNKKKPKAGRPRGSSSWKKDQWQAITQAIDLLSHHLLGFFILIIFASILLSLPLTLTYILHNVNEMGESLHQDTQISVYLTPGLSNNNTNTLIKTVRAQDNIDYIEHISQQQGLEEFEKESGLSKLTDYLGYNPIPGIILVRPTAYEPSVNDLKRIVNNLSLMPGVENVAIDTQLLEHALKFTNSLYHSIAIVTIILYFLTLVILTMLMNFLLPESLSNTSNTTMVYLGLLLGIIAGMLSDYLVSYFSLLVKGIITQLTFLNVIPSHFELSVSSVVVNQIGSWIMLTIAALIVRKYHLKTADKRLKS